MQLNGGICKVCGKPGLDCWGHSNDEKSLADQLNSSRAINDSLRAQLAASPDLLEACKLALDYLQKGGFKDGDAYSALLKAIARAEGGE